LWTPPGSRWSLRTLRNVRGTQEFPHVAVDVNWWKTFVHGRLAVASGDPGALTLYGKSADQHGLFAAHVVATSR